MPREEARALPQAGARKLLERQQGPGNIVTVPQEAISRNAGDVIIPKVRVGVVMSAGVSGSSAGGDDLEVKGTSTALNSVAMPAFSASGVGTSVTTVTGTDRVGRAFL